MVLLLTNTAAVDLLLQVSLVWKCVSISVRGTLEAGFIGRRVCIFKVLTHTAKFPIRILNLRHFEDADFIFSFPLDKR